MLKTKLWIFLKQKQPRIIGNNSSNVHESRRKPRKQSEHKTIKAIHEKIIRAIRKLFEQEEDYNKLVRVDNFYCKNILEYESNSEKK